MRKQEEAMGKWRQDISTPSILGSQSRVSPMHSLPTKNCKEVVPTWIHLCLVACRQRYIRVFYVMKREA